MLRPSDVLMIQNHLELAEHYCIMAAGIYNCGTDLEHAMDYLDKALAIIKSSDHEQVGTDH